MKIERMESGVRSETTRTYVRLELLCGEMVTKQNYEVRGRNPRAQSHGCT